MQQVNALPTNTLDLKDIHVPEQIANYPIAYGWWLLTAVIIFIIVITLVKINKAAKHNRVKKQALAQLKFLLESNTSMKNTSMKNTQTSNNDIIALLKWAAMHYFSRAELAKMFGDTLKEFFTSKLPSKHQQNFATLSEQAFINQYQAHLEATHIETAHLKADSDSNNLTQSENKLHQAAMLWLTHALPPKPPKPEKPQGVNS